MRNSILLFLAIAVSSFSADYSKESDSLALVEIKKLNPNSEKMATWSDTLPLADWNGVTLTEDRVSELALYDENIDSLPEAIGDLQNLTRLSLGNNNLNSLPTRLNELTLLRETETVEHYYGDRYALRIEQNNLNFGDLEGLEHFESIVYKPQRNPGIEGVLTDSLWSEGDICTLTIDAGGELTRYHWTKDGRPLNNDSDTLIIAMNSYRDCGLYRCSVYTDNSRWKMLTFTTDTITVATEESFALRAEDSLVLRTIAEKNPGHYPDWHFSQPLETWRDIEIENNRVGRFDVNALRGAELSDIPKLTGLEELHIFGSDDDIIPESIPWKELNIRRLAFISMYMPALPAEVWEMSSLEELKISGMHRLVGTVDLSALTNLKKLEVRTPETFAITGLGSLKKIRELVLYNSCTIDQLDGIGNLQELSYLFLEYSGKSLPDEVTTCSALEYLHIVHDYSDETVKLQTLPERIGDLKNLKTLKLRACDVSSLPNSIGELESLEEIDFWWNNVSELPESFGNLSNLKWMSFYHNSGIESLPTSFSKLTNLEHVDLGYNKLNFEELEYLETLPLKYPGYTVTSGQTPEISLDGSRELAPGENLSLTVNYSGGDSTRYLWYKDDQLLETEGDTLRISSVNSDDAGTYYVIMENPLFSSNTHYSDTVEVLVEAPTSIVKESALSVNNSKQFTAYPNVVTAGEESLVFHLSSAISGTGEIRIYDYLNNLVDSHEISVQNGGRYSWNCTNRSGRRVSSDRYLALLRYTNETGEQFTHKLQVGVQVK